MTPKPFHVRIEDVRVTAYRYDKPKPRAMRARKARRVNLKV